MTTAVEKYIEEFGPMTRAEAHRVLVCNFDAAGLSPAQISVRIGITPDRVERILDQLDGVPHDIDPTPAIEPLSGKVVHSEVIPIRPARTTQADPEPTRSTPEPVKPAPEPVKPAERPAATGPGTFTARVHGNRRGYQQHYRLKEKPCDDCRNAWNKSEQDKRAAAKAEVQKKVQAPPKKRVHIPAKAMNPARRPVQPSTAPAGPAAPRVVSRREYGLKRTTGVVAVDADAARAARNAGATVYRRTVTEWEIVP